MDQRRDSNSAVAIAAGYPLQNQNEEGSRDTLTKLAFDRVSAGIVLFTISPIMLGIAACIWARDPGPILYSHRRIGKDGRTFGCLKFRTMAVDADAILARHLAENPDAAREWEETQKLKDDPRVTPLGRTLRRLSLDELPQLINILKGEMSVVGPRPIVKDEVRHYGAAIRDYISVRPGLTGLWQVSGRSDVGYRDRVKLDQQYVRQRNFWTDLGIIFRTISVVVRRQGSY
jgi:exopolysaccharide production protein ExoY